MKAVILARVSTKEQEEGYSTPAQVARLTEYANKKGIGVDKVFEFTESTSAKIRKKFEELLHYVLITKDIGIIIADTVDRVTRNFKDAVKLDDLRKEGKIELHFLRESLVVNKNSNSADILRWDMAVMFAKSYILQLSDNVKRSLEQKLRDGEWPQQAPIGYKNVTLSDDKKWIELDKEKALFIKKAFELYATGHYSMNTLRGKLKDEGFTSRSGGEISKGEMDKILKNPFYSGIMEMKGKFYPHHYETTISKETYDKVQQVKANWNKKPFKWGAKPFAYRGLIACEDCGCMISAQEHKGHNYYHCTEYHGKHGAQWLREEELTAQFNELLSDLTIPTKVLNWLVDNLRKAHSNEKNYHDEAMTNLKREYSKSQSKLDILYEDRLEGRITAEVYDKKVEEVKKKQQDILLQMEEHSKADKDFLITNSRILELANRASKLFESSKVEEKRQLLGFLLQNCKLKGKELDFTLQKPFDAILTANKTSTWLP